MIPETRYAKTSDGIHIAYQVLGEGPIDLVYVGPWVTHIEYRWELPQYASYLRRMASFSRLIMFDKRGFGMSDPVPADQLPNLGTRMDDLRAVVDEVGSHSAVIYGASESEMLDLLFAATYPERTMALVIHGSYPSAGGSPRRRGDGARMSSPSGYRAVLGNRGVHAEGIPRDDPGPRAPAVVHHVYTSRREPRRGDRGRTHGVGHRCGDILSAIHVPTLILHRVEDDPEANRYMAKHIAGAEYVALPGNEHIPYLGDQDSVLREIERFVKGIQAEQASLDRVLATVLFTDVVGSTEKAAQLGDSAWRDLLEQHHATVRRLLAHYRGTEVDTAGDGFFATFDGPARAIRCAQAILDTVARLGLEVRAGLHTGECETIAGKVGGIAVNIGARVGSIARPSEVLVSRTVKDLVAGSGLSFEDAGEHVLKGVPERWHLYRVVEGRT